MECGYPGTEQELAKIAWKSAYAECLPRRKLGMEKSTAYHTFVKTLDHNVR